jgi:peptidase M1-like protein
MKGRRAAVLVALLLCGGASARAQDDEPVRQFVGALERVVQTGDAGVYFGLLGPSANRETARDFASTEIVPGASRAAVHERDRKALQGTPAGSGYSLLIEVIAEFGSRARIATWRVDIKRTGQAGAEREWTIADQERLSAVENIYRLSLNAAKAFSARNLKIAAEDLDLTMPEGSVYVGDVDLGVTAVVLMGRGMLNFHPAPATEKGQVKIFCGNEALETRFDIAYLRVNPSDYEQIFDQAALQPKAVEPGELRRAQEIFREESQKSFVIDLGDLSREAWTLLPAQGDFLAELRTRRFDTLTYARSSAEAEDITLFDRKRHKNISLYPSREKNVQRGQASYNEDDLVDYDILSYDIDVSAIPDRQWIDGRATLRLKVRAYVLGTLMLRLADSLVVQSIVSYEYGRLFGIRVKNQNTLVVNLPTTMLRDNVLTLTIAYAGRLEPQAPERETIGPLEGQRAATAEDSTMMIAAEPSYLYSSRNYWYPQAPVSDYATARIHLSVPTTIDAVASGELEPGFPTIVAGKDPTQNRKLYVFTAAQPLRYLAFIMSRFARVETSTIAFPTGRGAADGPDAAALNGTKYHSLNLSVETNPRQVSRGRDLADRAADIALFYESILGDSPYSSFTVALIESDLPGGHSPGYFAALNQQLPTSGLVWRNDPAAFPNYPDFFIAHELAHQWWGQAVGWRNYHEQWLSEGFAQYFAAMYAQQQRGEEGFTSVLKQLRRWGMDATDQGPISLGYRLGHIRGESRVFRALVYNKSAAVLHMLRRLVGDDAFFRGVRRFYREARFKKVGTQDFRAAMEKESGRDLERFFDRWIYGSTLPKLKVGYRVEGSEVVLHVEQIGELFDVPITVTLQYADRKPVDIIVAVTDRTVDHRTPLEGVLRGIDISKEDGTMAEIVKN